MFTQNFTTPNPQPDGSVNFDDSTYPLQPGDIVVPFFEAGDNQDKEIAKKTLEKDKKYTVRGVYVYPSRTTVFLEGFFEQFNMVNLEKVS